MILYSCFFFCVVTLKAQEDSIGLDEIKEGESKIMIFNNNSKVVSGTADGILPSIPINLNGNMYYGYEVNLPVGVVVIKMKAENYTDKNFPSEGNYSFDSKYASPDYNYVTFEVFVDNQSFESNKQTKGSFRIINSSEENKIIEIEFFAVDLSAEDGTKIDLQGALKARL